MNNSLVETVIVNYYFYIERYKTRPIKLFINQKCKEELENYSRTPFSKYTYFMGVPIQEYNDNEIKPKFYFVI